MTGFLRKLHYGETISAREFRKGQKGFTLIELLVVVALLGILAAVAIPNVASFVNEGEQEANDTDFANVQTAVLALMMSSGQDQLDNSYTAIDTEEEVQGVTAGTENLYDYLIGLKLWEKLVVTIILFRSFKMAVKMAFSGTKIEGKIS